MTMGTMISSLRKEHGMTQAELAGKMGVTDKAVSKWERDLSCPDISSLPKLAQELEVSVEELLQAKTTRQTDGPRLGKKIEAVVALVLKAVALAMGAAVVVLSILKQADLNTLVLLLGIGLACVGVSLLSGEKGGEG